MRFSRVHFSLLALGAFTLGACRETALLPISSEEGPHPALPAPVKSVIPTTNVATARGWASGAKPTSPAGAKVTAFAAGLEHPRWIYVLPNGDLLVAETNAPPKPEDHKGAKGWLMKQFMKKAGSAGPSANRLTLLRDSDHDGKADVRTVFASGLSSPLGMALVGPNLYVADTDAVVRIPYVDGDTVARGPGAKLVDLPAGPINHHWTKNIIASPDGTKLYAAIGSNSNAGENGADAEVERAAIWEIDIKTGAHRVFASGLRNPCGLAWEPQTGTLWTSVNERDELGSDLPPDYLTSVHDGDFYGFPYSYFGHHVDARAKPPRPDLVAKALTPDYALGPHTASLGLAFADKGTPVGYARGMYVGQHGSWNRRPLSGYKVIFVPFADGKPKGAPVDVLTGFLSSAGEAYGRPVGVAVDKGGDLFVADDVGNTVWRVAAAPVSAAR
ncbi:MAG TPA: sorbosone dehydrogenase family protein [Polyangia bacterium]|nr:sorbosone dehydrogenase family protein [Polyangia bacterium]